MSSRSWQLRVQDMLESIESILQSVENVSGESLQNNQMLTKAILFDFLVIGEAANNIDQTIINKYPEISWSDLIGMRNLMIHQYFRINVKILWDTVKNDLPVLKHQLENLLEQEIGK